MTRAGAAAATVVLASSLRAVAQTPAQDGQWDQVFPLPLIAIHAAMLPTGKVLLFGAEHGVLGSTAGSSIRSLLP